ncbi:aldehyde dehydrogenase family protein [Ovoidimarina sediminis]|uniref:aldehyde dehydrogenase family protein n=1 Tax=Ovoidimarina sediminis TaxID=3079856 RepID=UPI0029092B8A|nr:aldehyde dehydrogenase family protein [Rhodophyticola sp. MJ-SS7]MDU8945724.1 aldehyde dehydrogenase family protein [Rhodophyticola sp. MJ-SS7]
MPEGDAVSSVPVLGGWTPQGNFVAGEWRTGGGAPRAVLSPSSGAVLAELRDASAGDLSDAVARASNAQRVWTDLGPVHRGKILKQAAALLRSHESELALIDALDCGNPIKGMRFDVNLGATLMEFFAGLTTEAKGETIPQVGGKLTLVTREPLGVVARLVPFNHPFMFAAAKIAAPLAAGNAVILKPSEETPLSSLRMAEIIGDLFPDGLLSVLTGGADLGAAICAHPGIAAVGLIGSVPTGRAVLKGGADTLKRTQLELGGKNALVICEDADLDRAVAGAVKGMNLGWTAGQSCGSTSRVLVHETHYAHVVSAIAAAFDAVRLGDPTDEATEMGALSTRAQYDKTLGFIERARKAGARIAAGRPDAGLPDTGFFVRPTLVCDVGPEAEIAREEVFGPVLTVLKWRDESEMLDIVNSLDLGLTASIWTRDLDRALRLTRRIQAGYVWVNDASDHYLGAPFGGVKQSGLGREECLEEMLAYTEAKTVTLVSAG